MALSAFSATSLPFIISGGTIGLLVLPWIVRLPRYSLGILFISLVSGQVIRLPFAGQGGGLLPSDIAVVLVLVSAVIKRVQTQRLPAQGKFSLLCITPFLLWSLFTLAVHTSELGAANTAIAGAYWIRLMTHMLLFPALLVLFRDYSLHMFTQRGLLIAMSALILLGFLQLAFVPNLDEAGPVLRSLGEGGWDPHQKRLLSTWLDPNFFGAALAISLPYIAVTALSKYTPSISPELRGRTRGGRRSHTLGFGIILAASLGALLLTRSRSSLIAFGCTLAIFSPLLIARTVRNATTARLVLLGVVATLVILGSILALAVLGERAIGVVSFDPTVVIRAETLKRVWQLAEENSLVGVGYNAYQFAALRAGLIDNATIHSRAGADNSILTLWITTGLPGSMLFLAPWVSAITLLMHRWIAYKQASALAAALGMITLTIHSQFINSILYAHLLIIMITIGALAMTENTREYRDDISA